MKILARIFCGLLLTSCSVARLEMRISSDLKKNSKLYSIIYPNKLIDKVSDNKYNATFGPYRVSDMKLSWTASNLRAENPDPFFTFTNVRRDGEKEYI